MGFRLEGIGRFEREIVEVGGRRRRRRVDFDGMGEKGDEAEYSTRCWEFYELRG